MASACSQSLDDHGSPLVTKARQLLTHSDSSVTPASHPGTPTSSPVSPWVRFFFLENKAAFVDPYGRTWGVYNEGRPAAFGDPSARGKTGVVHAFRQALKTAQPEHPVTFLPTHILLALLQGDLDGVGSSLADEANDVAASSVNAQIITVASERFGSDALVVGPIAAASSVSTAAARKAFSMFTVAMKTLCAHPMDFIISPSIAAAINAGQPLRPMDGVLSTLDQIRVACPGDDFMETPWSGVYVFLVLEEAVRHIASLVADTKLASFSPLSFFQQLKTIRAIFALLEKNTGHGVLNFWRTSRRLCPQNSGARAVPTLPSRAHFSNVISNNSSVVELREMLGGEHGTQ